MARRIIVTVGMGRWPFDRLLRAITPLCRDHEVFAQTGTSAVVPPCPHAPFVDADVLDERLREADVVITHAGNTVRVVQRMGRVPIAVAREASRGEMGNDHQVAYLQSDARGPVIVAQGELDDLSDLVDRYDELAAAEQASHPVSDPVDPATLRRRIDTGLSARLGMASWIEAHLEHRPGRCLLVTPPPDRGTVALPAPRAGTEITSRIRRSRGHFPTVVMIDVEPSEARGWALEAAHILAPDGLLLLASRPALRSSGSAIELLAAVEQAGWEPVERSVARDGRFRRRHLLAARRRS